MPSRPETITRTIETNFTHKKIIPADQGRPLRGEFAKVVLRLEPLPRGDGLRFSSAVNPDWSRPEFVMGAEAGIRAGAQAGILTGGPVVDIHVTLLETVYHYIDSKEQYFCIAAENAFRNGLHQAGAVIVED